MVVDPLASRGIEVGPPSEETYARFEAAGIKVARARLIDLTLVGARYEVMKAALDILTTAPEFDLVVTVVGSSARFYPDLAVRPIIDSADAAKPIAAFLVPEAPQARAELAKAGVANFCTPEACADAVAAALSRRLPRPIATVGGAARYRDGCARRRRPAARRARGLRRARPRRRAAGAVGRARHRRRGAAACRSPIRSPRRCSPPRSRTSRMSAASCSASPTRRRCRRDRRRCGRGRRQAAARPGPADDHRPRRGPDRLPGRSPMPALIMLAAGGIYPKSTATAACASPPSTSRPPAR